MVEPWPELLVGAAAFALFLALHGVAWHRLGADRAGFGLMVGSWAVALATALGGAFFSGVPVHGLAVLAVHGCLMALYLHLYTGMLRSVSLRLLGELEARGGEATLPMIEAEYSPEAMLEMRLAWLVDRGWLESTGGDRATYALTPAGRRILAWRRPLVAAMVEGPTG